MVIKQEFTFPSSDGVHTVAAAWWRPEGPPPVSRTAYNGFFHIGMPLADSMGEGPAR